VIQHHDKSLGDLHQTDESSFLHRALQPRKEKEDSARIPRGGSSRIPLFTHELRVFDQRGGSILAF
jgi:hypothetical protein